MTRETKVGLIVAGSFLSLMGGVFIVKMRQGEAPTAASEPPALAAPEPAPPTTVAVNPPSPSPNAVGSGVVEPPPNAIAKAEPVVAKVEPSPLMNNTPLVPLVPEPKAEPPATPLVPPPAEPVKPEVKSDLLPAPVAPVPDPVKPEVKADLLPSPEPIKPEVKPDPPAPAVAPAPEPIKLEVKADPPPAPASLPDPIKPEIKPEPKPDIKAEPPPPMPSNASDPFKTVGAPPAIVTAPSKVEAPPPSPPPAPPAPELAKEPTASLQTPNSLPAGKPLPLPASVSNVQATNGSRPLPATPVSTPVNDSYLEEEYRLRAGESFASISSRFYFSDKYDQALRQYNRDYPLASAAMRRDPPAPLSPGTVLWIPPIRILEKRYPSLIPDLKPLPDRGSAPPLNATSDARSVSATFKTYQVRAGGETMLQIARRTQLSDWTVIHRLNPTLDPNAAVPIPAGTLLRLPAESNLTSGQ